MRKTAIALVLAVLMTGYARPSNSADFQRLVSGKQIPLTLQLKELNSSWRQVAIGGQFEMGDLMTTWSSFFGGGLYSNVYYTQGETVKVSGETYLVAYRLPAKGEKLSFKTLIESTLGASGCSESSADNKLTPETPLALSLLNLRTIGSLNDVRSFNLDEAIAASEKAYQQAQAACEQTQGEAGDAGAAEPKHE